MIATAEELKRWSTAQAQAALAGFQAVLIDGDDARPMLVVTRWALCRSFTSIDEAERWVLRAQGAAVR